MASKAAKNAERAEKTRSVGKVEKAERGANKTQRMGGVKKTEKNKQAEQKLNSQGSVIVERSQIAQSVKKTNKTQAAKNSKQTLQTRERLDPRDFIQIIGARENNLKNISLNIPKNQLVVFTGLSGSGKSTLAFDTLYAEGQRRYIESLSSYARQFLDKVGKPSVDKIEGLTPAIAIDQKTTSKNPRSTVGTITEIYDYLRLMFARVGQQHCHKCGQKISQMSAADIIEQVLALPRGARLMLLAPIIKEKKGSFAEKLAELRNKGFVRAEINGIITRLDEEIDLPKNNKHTIKVIIDRVENSAENATRIAQGVEKALDLAFGEVEVEVLDAPGGNLAANLSLDSTKTRKKRGGDFNDDSSLTPSLRDLDAVKVVAINSETEGDALNASKESASGLSVARSRSALTRNDDATSLTNKATARNDDSATESQTDSQVDCHATAGAVARNDDVTSLASKATIRNDDSGTDSHVDCHDPLRGSRNDGVGEDSSLAKKKSDSKIQHQRNLIHYSLHFACFTCKESFTPLEPLSFSFNSPIGACADCGGLGAKYSLDVKKIIDKDRPLADATHGAIKVVFGFNKSYYAELFSAFLREYRIDTALSFNDQPREVQNMILYGSPKPVKIPWKKSAIERPWRGVLPLAYEILQNEKDFGEFTIEKRCSTCGGNRLKEQSLAVKVASKNIGEVINMPIKNCYEFFADDANFAYLSAQNAMIAAPILKEIRERLFFLYDVGLGYLTLGRDARSISGGESQRIRIASQIGSGLTGVMYVLDEPSIGLHERDTLRLIKTLRNLQERGNSVIVVEHDKETMRHADFIVDIGPGAGQNGGSVVFAGTYENLLKHSSMTADYLNGVREINYRKDRPQKDWLEIKNVNINNIENLRVKIPLGNFVCVSGVSGSGKSSLILQTLLPVAQEILNNARKVHKVDGVEIVGLDKLDKVIYLDQSPIGRTPRSNPATYTGVMDEIRALFAQTKEAKLRGYGVGRFSFNVSGGRCERCQGEGEIKIEMHFLPDVLVKCDACGGAKYNAQTLEILYRGKSIADVLNMSVSEAVEFFAKVPKVASRLKTIEDVGLGYICLGQNALTLSGGEAQRIKLSKELGRKDTGKTLYILDEPTTGLHFADVDRLTGVLHHLVELGNSVIVIEHNLDMIKNADYIIDMGPEGGSGGGKIIATGSVSSLASNYATTGSHTGEFLSYELAESKRLSKSPRPSSSTPLSKSTHRVKRK